jgi:tetraacyldisaccharide 4'-kinase
VCIGNPTVGGAGKTPLTLTLARILLAAGERPVLLSRGYGGRLAGPVKVEAGHGAADVGDEPLLLARAAPTFVARNRTLGARAATAAGASVVVLDDGFQNPSLHKDVAVLVIDGRRGIGNGRVFPAGPLRLPLAPQLARAHAVVVVGTPASDFDVLAAARAQTIPVFGARLEPDAAALRGLRDARVLAFAGIGDPEKFFATLRSVGVAVAAARSFPDHHRYRPAESRALCEEADRQGLVLVTTEKDQARMRGDPAVAPLAARTRALPVTLILDDAAAFEALVLGRLAESRRSGQ